MAKGLGTLTVWLTADTKRFNSGLSGARKQLLSWKNAAIAGMAAATAGIAAFGVSAVKTFIDVTESVSKFNVVFSQIPDKANFVADSLSRSFGIASSTARELLGDTGDLLTGFGYTQEEALKMANATNKLAIDLASFTNYEKGAAGASSALIKAFTGEREAIKALGIIVREEMVMEKLVASGKDKLTGMALAQAKAEATLAIATEQSKNAVGDFARTQDQAANQIRITQEAFKDIKVSIGDLIFDVAGLSDVFSQGTNSMRSMAESLKDNLEGIKFLFKSIVIDVQTAFQKIWALFSVSIGNIESVFTWVSDNWAKLLLSGFGLLKAVQRDVLATWKNAFVAYLDIVKAFWKAVVSILKGGNVEDALMGIMEAATDGAAKLVGDLGKNIEAKLKGIGVTPLKLLGFDDLKDEFSRLSDEAERRKEKLFLTTLGKVGAIGVPGSGATKAGEPEAQKQAAARIESPIVEAIHRGSVEALRAETTRRSTDSKIETNTQRTANGIDKLVNIMERGARPVVGLQTEDAFA